MFLRHDTTSTLAYYPHYYFMSLLFQGLQVYAKMGRAPHIFFSYLQCRTGKCKLLLLHGKKKKFNLGNDWKAQEIFHCKISTETQVRNKFLPSCLILLEYMLCFYDSHAPLWIRYSKIFCSQWHVFKWHVPTVREHSLYKALLIVLVAQLGFLQGKTKHWIQGSGPKFTTYFNQILIINFLLFKKRVFHISLIHLKGKKKPQKKKIKRPGVTGNMRGKWCADNCSLCNNGNTFLLPALEILIVDAAGSL